MRKKIGRILIWAASIVLLLFITFAITLYLNREKIKQAVLTEVNQVLEVPVSVQKVDVSLRKFPYASLLFNEVFCPGANASQGDTLLYAREMYFEFNLWNVFSDNLSIKRISLNDGTAHIMRPEKGKPNYEIWKKDSSSHTSIFTLDEVVFKNFKLHQYEGSIGETAIGFVQNLSFSGSFAPEKFAIKNQGELWLDSLVIDNVVYLKNSNINTSFELEGNSSSSRIFNGNISVQDIPVSFAVDIRTGESILKAGQPQVNLKALQGFIRSQHWSYPKDMDVSGTGSMAATCRFQEGKSPDIQVEFSAQNADLRGFHNSRIHNFSCSGSYALQQDRDHIRLNSFKGDGRTGSFEGSMDIDNLSRPGIVLDLKSNLEISEWLIFMPLDTITKPEGRAIVDLHFENNFKSLENISPDELKRAKASGNFKLENVGFTFKNSEKRIEGLNGDLQFLGNDLKVSSFFFRTGSSDIFLEGMFGNVLNYLYFDNEKLRVDTRVRSQQLQMEDFIVSRGANTTEENYNLDFVKSLDLDLDLQVNRFLFDKFFASDIRGNLEVKNGVIKAHSISLHADEGDFNGNFSIDTRPENHYELLAGLNAHSVNIHDIFVSFKNFGQSAIVADNLYGKADFNMELSCNMNPQLDIDIASIEMKSHLTIENGNLKNYEPMLALSRFADLDELKDVKFARLQNDISISHSQVIIPEMNISSNILDLGIQGRHGFDNNVDYIIRMKLGDVLFTKRKNKSHSSEFDEHLVEVQKDDDPNIYVRMHGPATDPTIELDKKSIGKSIGEDLKEQKKELKNIFKKEADQPAKKDDGIKYDLFGDEKGK